MKRHPGWIVGLMCMACAGTRPLDQVVEQPARVDGPPGVTEERGVVAVMEEPNAEPVRIARRGGRSNTSSVR